jgi:glutamine synthetase
MTNVSIEDLSYHITSEFALAPVMAAEIECYVMLADESPASMDAFWVPVEKAFRHEGLPILRIEKERGLHQYEVITQVMPPQRLAETLVMIRSTIEKYAARMSVQVHFAAKPFADQPSSGLHVHTHLADEQGQNVFHKTEEWTSDYLRHSLGGLLANMRGDMPIFFPNEADYKRLDDVDHVPKIFGWGVNNRYCALRIPMDPDLYNKHIEHRVPCANADAYAVIAAILLGILRGLREGIEPPEQAHGKFLEGAEFKQALLPAPIG